MKLFLTLFIIFSSILSYSQIKDGLRLELTYNIYCQESLIGRELIIDSCFNENGTFEFNKPFIKHNKTEYLVEVLEKYGDTSYIIASMGGKNIYLYLIILFLKKEV